MAAGDRSADGRRGLGRNDGLTQNTGIHAAGSLRDGAAAHHLEYANEFAALDHQTGRRVRRKMGQAEAVYTARLQQLNNPTQHQ